MYYIVIIDEVGGIATYKRSVSTMEEVLKQFVDAIKEFGENSKYLIEMHASYGTIAKYRKGGI